MKQIKWLLLLISISGLIGVRVAEEYLFYDPFLLYFKESSIRMPFPDFNWSHLVLNHIYRFLLNLIFSSAVMYALFSNRQWMFQAVFLMLIIFAVTFSLYLYSLHIEFRLGELFSFYMRRFVIHPVSLLILVSIFYYRNTLHRFGGSV